MSENEQNLQGASTSQSSATAHGGAGGAGGNGGVGGHAFNVTYIDHSSLLVAMKAMLMMQSKMKFQDESTMEETKELLVLVQAALEEERKFRQTMLETFHSIHTKLV